MYSPEFRDRLREVLLERAKADPRISGAAITGSAAHGTQDAYSDIDLAFGIRNPTEILPAIAEWTSYVYGEHGALHHLDMPFGAWLYRVFLLPGTLQLDLAFVPAEDFRPLAFSFRLVFGEAQPPRPPQPSSPDGAIGIGWLYAIHARSCIARKKFWQAEYMISGVRDTALALACVRHGLPCDHGRGMDQLPPETAAPFEEALVRSLNQADLVRAFGVAVERLAVEIRRADPGLADRVEESLRTLADSGPNLY